MAGPDEALRTPPPFNDPRPTPLPSHADRPSPATTYADIPPAPNVRAADSGSGTLTSSASVTPASDPVGQTVASEDAAMIEAMLGGKSGGFAVRGADATLTVWKAGTLEIRLRPVEAMLRDPLGDVARKERRSLLGISAIAILIGRTGLVPAKIENFGISFATPERQALLWVFVAVVVYYTAAFIVYAISDSLSWGYAVDRGNRELIKQSEAAARRRDQLSPAPTNTVDDQDDSPEEPWPLVGLVTPASLLRGAFDFVVPVLVAGYAIWALWGAVTHVETRAPAVTPATAPAPTLKAR